MIVASPRTAAIRMSILMVVVCALDVTVVFFAKKPFYLVCSISALLPLMTPAILFPSGAARKSKN